MPEPDDVDIWISEGERAARHVAERALVLVTGDSVAAAALVALGVARAEAATRRVAVIDLAGDVPPLRELVTDEDPHGVVDTILHGVSLARVSRQVDDAGHMFVIPTGTQPPDEFVVGHTDGSACAPPSAKHTPWPWWLPPGVPRRSIRSPPRQTA